MATGSKTIMNRAISMFSRLSQPVRTLVSGDAFSRDNPRGLEYLQNTIFKGIAVTFIVVGGPLFFYGAYLFFAAGSFIPAAVEALIYILSVFVLLNKHIGIVNKKLYFVALLYACSILVLVYAGAFGAGLAAVIATLVFSGCLLDKNQLIRFSVFNVLTFVALTVMLLASNNHEIAFYQYAPTWPIVALTTQALGIGLMFLIYKLYSSLEHQAHIILKSQSALSESEQSYRYLFESSAVAIAYYKTDGTVVFYNQKAVENMGGKPEDYIGKSIFSLFPAEGAALYMSRIQRAVSAEETQEYEDYIELPGGTKWFFSTFNRILNQEGDVTGIQIISHDITERKLAEEHLVYLSFHDHLTKLHNRRFLEQELERLDAQGCWPASVIVADINGLKLINDAGGSSQGDAVLISAAEVLRSTCDSDVLLARVGGDDFCMLLPGVDMNEAMKIVLNIQMNIEEYNKGISDDQSGLDICFGVSAKEAPTDSMYEVVKTAEYNLAQRKLLEKTSSHSTVIASIKATMFEKSHETKQHADRLVMLSKMVATELGLGHAELDKIELFATLHDIGKIVVDERILNKPGALNDTEWVIMKTHPEVGYRIAKASPELVAIADYIVSHHERWDGKGYPKGLSGEDIPLPARILSIVDSFDAMTHARSYREPMTKEAAIQEIRDNAGTQFDPVIAEKFIELIS